MVNSDELFNWMVRNCSYYKNEITEEKLEQLINEKDLISLRVYVDYTQPFHIPLTKFEKFVNEPYTFSKHLLPLVNQNLIVCVPTPDSQDLDLWLTYQDNYIWGLVKDDKTNQIFVRFWIREKHE
jgi:hypothetical protein